MLKKIALKVILLVIVSTPAISEPLWHGSFGANGNCVLITLAEDHYSFEFGKCGGKYAAPEIEVADASAYEREYSEVGNQRSLEILTHEGLVYTFVFSPDLDGNKLEGDWSGPTGKSRGSLYKKDCVDATLCEEER